MVGFDAWENKLFDEWNGEDTRTVEEMADDKFYGDIEERKSYYHANPLDDDDFDTDDYVFDITEPKF